MNSRLVTQTIRCIISQSNRVSWHVLMVWWKNKNILYFWELFISSLKHGQPAGKQFRTLSSKKSGEREIEDWRSFFSLIRSEKFARQAKVWTTEIVWILLCTLNKLHTRIILAQIKMGMRVPLAQNQEQKGHAKANNALFPHPFTD